MSEFSRGNDELNWQKIIASHPEAQRGQYNTDRKKFLRKGVFLDISRATAESWISELRALREGSNEKASDVVRVTIVSHGSDNVRFEGS